MSMPIQRQSEAFGIFDDGPRFAREKSSFELPRGLAGLVNATGPRITGGLLNTRQAGEKIMPWSAGDWEGAEQFSGDYAEDAYRDHPDSWSHQPTEQDYADWEARHPHLAINFGKGPRDHGGAGPDGGPAVPDWYYDGDSEDYDEDDEFGHDPDRYIPQHLVEGRRGSGRHPFDRTAACQSCGGEVYHISGEGFVHADTDDHGGWDIDAHHQAEPDEDDDRNLGLSSAEAWHEREGRRWYGQYDDLPPLPDDFRIPDNLGGENNTSGVEPWMDPEEFIKYHNDYFGAESDPVTQSNIRDMSSHSLHNYWQDLEKQRGKTPDQLRGERQQSKDKAKGIADGIWNAMYPPEEEEGRKAVQGMDTVNKLMDNGWGPEHIKYDEDDQPYAHYQHPSGWSVTDHGGMYKNIGHAATPGEAHDVINVSRNVDGQDYHAPFGPADAHAHIEEQLYGDPEETGGYLQQLTREHPAIRRYKPRQAAAAVQDPAAMAPQVPVGGGFQAGHRVGLDWRDSTVPGTVIANDGQVHVRWDDGQYTSEDPSEVRLL